VNEGYGSAANFTHCMLYVLSFESKIRKDLSKVPSVKVSDADQKLRISHSHCVPKLKGRKLENQKKKVYIVYFFGMVYKVCDVDVANLSSIS
jgi:hypothetical protein